MPEIKWIHITTSMFDDEKIKLIEMMPDADALIVIWVKLICQAGKINDGGAIYISPEMAYNDERLACIFNRPVNTVRLALKTFNELGMISITNTGVIYLNNWGKHQNIDGLLKIREDTRKRVQRFREKQRLLTVGNVTVAFSNETEEEEEEEEEKNKNNISPLEKMLNEKRYDEIMIDTENLSSIIRSLKGEQPCLKANIEKYKMQLKKLNISMEQIGIKE